MGPVYLGSSNFTSCTGFYLVFMGFTGFYWVLLGFTGFYRVLPGFTGFYQVLPSFTGFLSTCCCWEPSCTVVCVSGSAWNVANR